MTFWIFAVAAPAAVAVAALFFRSRRTSRGDTDQVSGDWLASARIHEDHL
jgi:hypothetical protein